MIYSYVLLRGKSRRNKDIYLPKELDLLLYRVHLENPFPNTSKRS